MFVHSKHFIEKKLLYTAKKSKHFHFTLSLVLVYTTPNTSNLLARSRPTTIPTSALTQLMTSPSPPPTSNDVIPRYQPQVMTGKKQQETDESGGKLTYLVSEGEGVSCLISYANIFIAQWTTGKSNKITPNKIVRFVTHQIY